MFLGILKNCNFILNMSNGIMLFSSGLRSDKVDQYSLGQLGPVMSVRLAQISQLAQIGSGKVRSVSSSRSGQIR